MWLMCSFVIATATIIAPSPSTKPPRHNNKWKKLKTKNREALTSTRNSQPCWHWLKVMFLQLQLKHLLCHSCKMDNLIDHFKIITLQSTSPQDSLPIFLKTFSTCFLIEFSQKTTLLVWDCQLFAAETPQLLKLEGIAYSPVHCVLTILQCVTLLFHCQAVELLRSIRVSAQKNI